MMAKRRRRDVHDYETLTDPIIGAAVQVHRVLGPGFLESIYESALALELESRRIPFQRQSSFQVTYRGTPVGAHRVDLLVCGKVVVELKAAHEIHGAFFTVMRSYLRATQLEVGLILNFGKPVIEVKSVYPDRVVREPR